jgi:putative tryptophan/tyrosine transport system substrate-binding protein
MNPLPGGDRVMDRRTWLVAFFGLLTAPLAVEAQQAAKIARLGWLSASIPPPALSQMISDRLREFGWVEGQNLVVERRHGGMDRLPTLAVELVQLKVEVILAQSNQDIAAARAATGTIPIVMLAGVDPVAAGFVETLGRPGGNVTGTTYTLPETGAKKLGMLKEAAPSIKSVAVLWNPAIPGLRVYLDEATVAAPSMSVRVHSYPVRTSEKVDSALARVRENRHDALYLITDAVIGGGIGAILRFAAENQLPAIYPSRSIVQAGGLMSYAPELGDLVRRSVSYVDWILRGARPNDLPVEQPTKFELAINLKTAKALGLMIPPSLLLRADQTIE